VSCVWIVWCVKCGSPSSIRGNFILNFWGSRFQAQHTPINLLLNSNLLGHCRARNLLKSALRIREKLHEVETGLLKKLQYPNWGSQLNCNYRKQLLQCMLCNHMTQLAGFISETAFAAGAEPKVHFIWHSDSSPPSKVFSGYVCPQNNEYWNYVKPHFYPWSSSSCCRNWHMMHSIKYIQILKM
jgi:hypothetical protein